MGCCAIWPAPDGRGGEATGVVGSVTLGAYCNRRGAGGSTGATGGGGDCPGAATETPGRVGESRSDDEILIVFPFEFRGDSLGDPGITCPGAGGVFGWLGKDAETAERGVAGVAAIFWDALSR